MGLLDFFRKKKEPQKFESPSEQRVEDLAKPKEEGPAKPKEQSISVPKKIGTCIRSYYYPEIKFSPSSDSERLALAMQDSNDWEVCLQQEDSKISIYYHGDYFGELLEKQDMAKDWIRRNDPIFCVLRNFGESGNYLALAFYRDEQKQLSSRKFTVEKLTRCVNEDAQINLIGIEEGDKLELEEDYEREDAVNVLFDGCEIGALPKRQAVKFLEEGCAGVFFDHMDSDDSFRDIPFVKIYW